MRVCKRPCGERGPASAMTEGLLVLHVDTISLAEFPIERRRHLGISRLGRPGVPNACFALRRRSRDIETYAGIATTGLTHWSVGPDSVVRIELYRSPDAGYEVRLRWRPGGLQGEGRSWTVGVADARNSDEEVVAERIGAPDIRRCGEIP